MSNPPFCYDINHDKLKWKGDQRRGCHSGWRNQYNSAKECKAPRIKVECCYSGVTLFTTGTLTEEEITASDKIRELPQRTSENFNFANGFIN